MKRAHAQEGALKVLLHPLRLRIPYTPSKLCSITDRTINPCPRARQTRFNDRFIARAPLFARASIDEDKGIKGVN